MTTQRQWFKSGKLSDERIAQLDAIGFEWEISSSWAERLQQLEEYKAIHGNCRVPQRYKENPSLGIWVNTQRHRFKSGKLPDEQIAQLEAIGFQWSAYKNCSSSVNVANDDAFDDPIQ